MLDLVIKGDRVVDGAGAMSAPRALVIGGSGTTGPHILTGLLARGYNVTMLHRGTHEPGDLPDVEHLHADPHFVEPLQAALGDREFEVVIATYGRLKAVAEAVAGRCGQLVGTTGSAPCARRHRAHAI